MIMNIQIVRVDYSNTQHTRDLLFLLNYYAEDPMGGGVGLSDYVKNNLIAELAKNKAALSIIAYVDNKPIALINCFTGFSTFKCQSLLNIHDVIVLREYRGLGISQKLLKEVEAVAKNMGACKLTLEVLEGNQSAQKAYQKFGFSGYELDASTGKAQFWEKLI